MSFQNKIHRCHNFKKNIGNEKQKIFFKFFSLGPTTPIGGYILQPSSGL